MEYIISGVGRLNLDTIILDMNGTLSVGGKIPNGVKERLDKLNNMGFKIVLFTADQRGTAKELAGSLGITFAKTKDTEEKRTAAKNLNKGTTVAIGNARIDIGTFENAKLRIATLQAEGIHASILPYVDVVVPSINDALDLLIDPDSLSATLRL